MLGEKIALSGCSCSDDGRTRRRRGSGLVLVEIALGGAALDGMELTMQGIVRSGLGKILGVALAAVLGVGVTGCSTNPATGRSQLNLLSRAHEISIGSEAQPQLVAEYGGEVRDPQLRAYVTRVGMSMVEYTEGDFRDLPWEFTLLDSDVINAFALPGGKVFVSRGLVQKMTNEAQLAAVLGHEIGHVTARHANDRISRQLILTGVVVGATVAAGQSDSDLVRVGVPVLVGTTGTGFSLSFDRNQELESDRLGMRYMTRAGYDPRGMLQLMEILRDASGERSQPEWLSTHPLPETRIRAIEQRLASGSYSRMIDAPTHSLYEERFRREFLSRLNQLADAGAFNRDVAVGEIVPIQWGGWTGECCSGCAGASCGTSHGH
ncbi:MAG: hypothetical protein EA380_03425 [Phycisphaeraceae bacterium]|nr:MAG: hypothetical protein EA380_03425 [Phycisphaeraceae bacterium]